MSITNIITAVAVCGAVLLIGATGLLVKLNWSEKLYGPLFSILLGGTVTVFITVLAFLKESTVESRFPTSVVFDTTALALPMFIPEQPNQKLKLRLNELHSLSRPSVLQDPKPPPGIGGVAVSTIESPRNQAEILTFCGELLQYQIIRKIRDLQGGSRRLDVTGQRVKSSIHLPAKLSRITKYPGETFIPILANNRFFNSDWEREHWRHFNFPLPERTQVRLSHQLSSPTTGPERHIIQFIKPLFFRVEIAIEFLWGTGQSELPEGLEVSPEAAKRLTTYIFEVAMNATFERYTAGNWQTEEHKRWVEWLFAGLRDALAD